MIVLRVVVCSLLLLSVVVCLLCSLESSRVERVGAAAGAPARERRKRVTSASIVDCRDSAPNLSGPLSLTFSLSGLDSTDYFLHVNL